MGTRHLIAVKLGGEPKIAQYGQWDGYPSGQGFTVLEFLRKYDRPKFENRLITTRFANEIDNQNMDSFFKMIGANDGWMTEQQSIKFKEEYPFASRDVGGNILQLVYDSELEEVILNDNMDFLEDTTFCEWAYIIDLDANTLEVYDGETTPAKTYCLTELPTNEEFLEDLVPKEEE
jgi:hypothetical protein